MYDMDDGTNMNTSSKVNSVRRRFASLPGGRGVQTLTGIAIALILVGMFVADGTMAGVLGLWGLSLLAVTVVGYVAYRLWYHYGS